MANTKKYAQSRYYKITQPLELTIQNLSSNSYSFSDLHEFVDIATKLSIGYLNFLGTFGQRVLEGHEHTTKAKDRISLDCISRLFRRNDTREFVEIKRYFKPYIYNGKKRTDSDWINLMKPLIIRATKQGLSRIYRDRDPEGAKALKNVRVTAKDHVDLDKMMLNGAEYVFYKPDVNPKKSEYYSFLLEYLKFDRPVMMNERLGVDFWDENVFFNTTKQNIVRLLDIVKEDGKFRKALYTKQIANILKEVRVQWFLKNYKSWNTRFPQPDELLEEMEIETLKSNALNKTYRYIDKKYVAKGKISFSIGEAMKKGLDDITYDMGSDNGNLSFFNTLQFHYPNIKYDQYRGYYRFIFEYLVKKTKKYIKEDLEMIITEEEEI